MRLGRTGMSQTHACMQPGSARTAHLLASVSGRIPCASFWFLFCWPGHCEPIGSEPHCFGVHQELLLILEDGKPARFHFAALVHGTLDPHVPGHVGVGGACDGLNEVSTKKGDLPYLLLSYATIHGNQARRELT